MTSSTSSFLLNTSHLKTTVSSPLKSVFNNFSLTNISVTVTLQSHRLNTHKHPNYIGKKGMQQTKTETQSLELLRQLIGEWSVGIAMKVSEDKIVSGCGEMTAVEVENSGINSEIDTHIEGYEDYFENDLWSIDPVTGKVHLYSMTSEGETHNHVGEWIDENTLELKWRGTFEDQEQEEHIIARWISKDHFELKETNLSSGKTLVTTTYVFKRKNLIPVS